MVLSNGATSVPLVQVSCFSATFSHVTRDNWQSIRDSLVPFEIRVVDGKCYTSVDPDTEFAVDGKQHTAACVRQEDPSMLEGSRKRRKRPSAHEDR